MLIPLTQVNPKPHKLLRFIRKLAGALLAERKAINLYDEEDASEQFESEAKWRASAVVACDFNSRFEPHLDGVVDPLAYAKQEKGQKEQKCLPLGNEINLPNNTGNHPGRSDDREGVPPVVYLEPGERITHMWKRETSQRINSDAVKTPTHRLA